METQNSPHPERFFPSADRGLTEHQVQQRRTQGLSNDSGAIKTQSEKQILLKNILTPFNILNFILAGMVLAVGSFKNMLFLGVIFCNILIGTFQEIRAKRTIDKLSLIAAPKAKVIREGNLQEITIEEIVLDDVMLLSSGGQICADAILLEGECEVNESLITGESDPVYKKPGDLVLSGSFVVSGSCRARTEHVGADNYANQITNSAKYVKRPNSEIMFWINRIIKWLGIALLPIGILLFCKQYFLTDSGLQDTVVSVVAALVGMIPEGLVLLTSVVLAVSVIRLSSHKTLVQELFCIETLARVDTLCLDKTGTITEGSMQVDELLPLSNTEIRYAEDALASLASSLTDSNPTFLAIQAHFSDAPGWHCVETRPFSSARKWSGASFSDMGTFVMGAAEFILKEGAEALRPQIEAYSQTGQRVLLLAHSPQPFREKELPESITPLALVVLSDKIRPEAPRTLRYFADQGVDLKVISGDNAVTVANIAKKAGLENADRFIDASTLHTEEELVKAASCYSVFGRVTPQQKLSLVKALKAQGHTVAMTGDGVNDVLALKEADCSVAMASGSDAARTVSQLVLLDSNFASMPRVVQEGRRSINNLQRSASLFLVKSIFSAILALCFIFLPADYPFQPIQMTLISALTIGAPSFILALEPNRERIRGKFIVNVIQKSLPAALTMVLNILLLTAIHSYMGFSQEQFSTMAVLLTGMTSLMMLYKVCTPFNLLRGALSLTMTLAFILAVIFFGWFFSLTSLNLPMILTLMMLFLFSVCAMSLFLHLIDYILVPQLDQISMEFQRQSRIFGVMRKKLFRKFKKHRRHP